MIDLKAIRKANKMTQEDLATYFGCDQSFVSQMERGKRPIPEEYISKILADDSLNKPYSLPGAVLVERPLEEDGVRYKRSPRIENSNGNKYEELKNGLFRITAPLVPAKAHARYVQDCFDVDVYAEFDSVDFVVDTIGRGKYVSFEIKGDSMDDGSKASISDGDMVLCREVIQEHWKNKLRINTYPYWIIVHKSSILCKQITEHDVESGVITCHSLNPSPEYPDFQLKLKDVKQLFNIIKVQSDRSF